MSFTSRMPVGPKKNEVLLSKNRFADRSKLNASPKRFYKKKWFIITMSVLAVLFLAGGIFAYKTGYVLNKISESDSSVLKSLFNVLPVVGKDELEGEEDGRINVALLGMRGTNMPGGGLLADSIMVVSLNTKENKVAMISIPRDLYVKVPGSTYRSKINAVHAFGEENGKKKGLSDMKQVLGEVTGLDIHYAVSINFAGFKQLIDAVGGIDINLTTPFYETHQFVEGKECGIEFSLPVGMNTLNGEKALCYARARDNTSDFDRAKRQQVMLKALKEKLISMGTLSDFSKVNNILNAVGDNVRTDMASYEMKEFFEKYSAMKDGEIYQRVFENSEEGLLMVPANSNGAGYILIPRAGEDNYSEIHNVCQNIFTLPPQSDIDPMKQYRKPAPKEINAEDAKKSDKKKKNSDAKKDGAEVKGTSSSKDTDTSDKKEESDKKSTSKKDSDKKSKKDSDKNSKDSDKK